MKEIPYGIIDFKKLIVEGYQYIDKTSYLEKLERVGDTLLYLRPGRFGKSLFTSMMFYYYDVASSLEFDVLFKDTHVYEHPTNNKNNYYCLKFDFSGISTNGKVDIDVLTNDFKGCVKEGIEGFKSHYRIDYTIGDDSKPDDLIKDFLSYVRSLHLSHKLYIIIDEYDNFTNAILEGDAKDFLNVVGNAGVIKSFYANIKIFVKESLVDRVFITGICPITLNAMTTGFNIATDISFDREFNAMIGLTHEEVKRVLDKYDLSNKDELFDIMIDNYDGYAFSSEAKEQVFNATLVMYFFKNLSRFGCPPANLYDKNISANYQKIENLLKLQNNPYYKDILESILTTKKIDGYLKDEFNLLVKFDKDDIISLLYYFGYLTIEGEGISNTIFRVPNQMMQVAYGEYFMKLLEEVNVYENNARKDESIIGLLNGDIEPLSNYVSDTLSSMTNRIFIRFDEKYIELLYFVLLMNIRQFTVKMEYECEGGYIDLLFEGNPKYTEYNIIVELKYIKSGQKNKKTLIEEKRREGLEQLAKYNIEFPNVKKYLVIFTGDKVEEITEA